MSRPQAGSAAMEQREDSISFERPRRPLGAEECRRWGKILLAQQLTWAERRAKIEWQLYDERGQDTQITSGVPGLVRAPIYPDLTTAIYLKLAELVQSGERYHVCRGCGGPFHPADRRQKYCDPRCGDATRQRLIYRQSDGIGKNKERS